MVPSSPAQPSSIKSEQSLHSSKLHICAGSVVSHCDCAIDEGVPRTSGAMASRQNGLRSVAKAQCPDFDLSSAQVRRGERSEDSLPALLGGTPFVKWGRAAKVHAHTRTRPSCSARSATRPLKRKGRGAPRALERRARRTQTDGPFCMSALVVQSRHVEFRTTLPRLWSARFMLTCEQKRHARAKDEHQRSQYSQTQIAAIVASFAI